MVEELTDLDVPVIVTAGYDAIARTMAVRTHRARTWLSSLLGFEPTVSLEILGAQDWEARTDGVVYGMPHVNESGTMYLAATDSELFSDTVELILEHLDPKARRQFEAVYGQPPSMRGFRDLLSIHELAHTYHLQAGFEIEPLWVTEFFCNLALQGFVTEFEPAMRLVLETLPVVASRIPPARQEITGLDEMSFEKPLTYVWYELRLQHAAVRIWEVGGPPLLRDLYELYRTAATDGVPVAPDRLPPAIARIASEWPNVDS